MAAFAHEVEIELAEEEGKGVGVVLLVGGAGGEFVLDAVGGWQRALLHGFGEGGFKETFRAELGGVDCGARIGEADGGGGCAGMVSANDPAAAGGGLDLMGAEECERIGVASDYEGVDGLIEGRFLWGGRLCDGFFDALFRQGCVSPTCREAMS